MRSSTSTLGGTTNSTILGSTIGSTIGSTHGSSSSESTSSGSAHVHFGNLSATRKPGGGLRQIETPTGLQNGEGIGNGFTQAPSFRPSYEKAGSSGKGKAPPPPKRDPPSRHSQRDQHHTEQKTFDDPPVTENPKKKESKEYV